MKKPFRTLITTTLVSLSLGACSQLGGANSMLSQLSNGYPSDAQNALQSLTNLSNPTQAISQLGSQYGLALGQLAGVAYDSPEYKQLSNFNTDFVQNAEHGNMALQSLLENFASDMATEAQVFQGDKPGYHYPALPASDAPESAYGSYRDALLNQFSKQALSRLGLYHKRSFQNKFLNISKNRREVPGMLKTADNVVGKYLGIIKLLTQKDPLCTKQEGALAKAMCFRQYLGLIAQYPKAMNLGAALLQGKSVQDLITPSLTQSLLGPVSQFVSKYVK